MITLRLETGILYISGMHFAFVFTSRQRGSVPVVEILCLENEGTERCPPVEKFPAHRVPPAHQAPEKNIITQVKD